MAVGPQDYAERFLGGRGDTPRVAGELHPAEGARRAARLPAIVAEQAPTPSHPPMDPRSFAASSPKADAFLVHLAEHHAYPHVGLLAED